MYTLNYLSVGSSRVADVNCYLFGVPDAKFTFALYGNDSCLLSCAAHVGGYPRVGYDYGCDGDDYEKQRGKYWRYGFLGVQDFSIDIFLIPVVCLVKVVILYLTCMKREYAF